MGEVSAKRDVGRPSSGDESVRTVSKLPLQKKFQLILIAFRVDMFKFQFGYFT